MEAHLVKDGVTEFYTPASACVAGQVIQLDDGRVGVCVHDIAASEEGEVYVAGEFAVENVAAAISVGALVGWDEDGTAVSTATGACTPELGDADFLIGIAKQKQGGSLGVACSATDTTVRIALNDYTGYPAEFLHMTWENVSANKTLDAQDVGKIMCVTADAKTVTLPATAAGYRFVVYNGVSNAGALVTVSPHADDKIMGADLGGTDNKDRLNTKATAYQGDFCVLLGDGSAGYYVTAERGTWAAET
jgi:predicted RecA/RadA family phage recombinase